MDFQVIFDAINNLLQGNITIEMISIILTAIVGILLVVLQRINAKTNYVSLVKEKMLLAEKFIDEIMYDDEDQYRQAREDLVVKLISVIYPKVNETELRKLIRELCEHIHEGRKELEVSNA